MQFKERENPTAMQPHNDLFATKSNSSMSYQQITKYAYTQLSESLISEITEVKTMKLRWA